jgi:predicted HAD superfamily phosphohydrolase YqeG
MEQQEENLLEIELLKTLSHFESMSIEFILIDFDATFLKVNPEFTTDDLKESLQALQKKKLIKRVIEDKQEKWIKVFPKKNLLKKIFSKFLP